MGTLIRKINQHPDFDVLLTLIKIRRGLYKGDGDETDA